MRAVLAVPFLVVSFSGCLGGGTNDDVASFPLARGAPTFVPDCSLAGAEARGEGTACAVFFTPVEAQTEAHLATHPSEPGTVLVCWRERADARIWARLTQDGGATWKTSPVSGPAEGDAASVPLSEYSQAFDCQAAFLPDGTALVSFGGPSEYVWPDHEAPAAWVYNVITLARSIDGGQSWSRHTVQHTPGGLTGSDFMALAAAPDSMRLLVTAQTAVYGPPARQANWVWSSDDGGLTWGSPSIVHLPPPAERQHGSPRVAQGAGGLAVIVTTSSTLLHQQGLADDRGAFVTSSRDGGETWEPPLRVADGYRNARGPPVVQADGTIETVLNDEGEGNRVVARALSKDGGRTWSAPEPLGRFEDPVTWAIGAAGPDGTLAVLVQTDNACVRDEPVANGEEPDPIRWTLRLLVPGRDPQILAGPLEVRPDTCSPGNDYAGLAFAADGSLWAAWADPRIGHEAPGIAVAHLVQTTEATP